MEKNHQLPYSYHTFLLAFYCPNGKLHPRGNWTNSTLSQNDVTSKGKSFDLDYATVQYFTKEARNLLFNENKSFCYEFDSESSDSDYVISRAGEVFRLKTTKVFAVMHGENVGVLGIALENRAYPDEKFQEKLNINKINEFGRRINLPYLTDDTHSLVADSISFFGETEDFRETTKDIRSKKISPTEGYVMRPIRRFITELMEACDGRELIITPVIDDRMFVCSLVRNQSFIEALSPQSPKPYDFIYTDPEISKSLYALGYIDADSATCQNQDMRERLLRNSVYARWRDARFDKQNAGTIDVITHHSFVRITNGGALDHIINSFLTQYVYMAIGALIQRATILWISNESARLSEDYMIGEKTNTKKFTSKLIALRKKYVYAQNNIFLDQLAVQEQGVDEFTLLKRELYIDTSLDKLEKKIDSIYHFTEEYVEREENHLLNMITFIGLPLAVINLIVDAAGLSIIYSLQIDSWFVSLAFWLSIAITAFSIGYGIFSIIKRRKI